MNSTLNYSPNFDKKKRNPKEIKFIVFHYTGMKKEVDAINRLINPKSKVSSHYFIKKNGSIINMVPDLYISWHAGISNWKKLKELNKFSIGIEIHNPGHQFGYQGFNKKQVNSVKYLSLNLAKKYKIDLVFFHGRGGSPGRGGGPIQATLKSQPSGTVNGKIRITDQGEVIQQKYGYKPLAEYNLCSYIGAVMDASLNPPPRSKTNWRELIQKMSEISTSSYRKYLNQSEDFIRYFKTVTPHKSLGKLAIGSRPTKRKNVDNIQSLRAIPWVFAWTQIRLMLPAWLGTTEALRYGSIKKFKRTMTDMERNWPYFVSTMDILDMVISKVDPEISVIYENNLADASLKRIGKKLRFQFEALVKLHNKITPKEVVKERKEFRKALFIRNNYTEMLNILQANVMNKLTNKKYKNLDKKFLEDALMTSIAGISAAMKNTG